MPYPSFSRRHFLASVTAFSAAGSQRISFATATDPLPATARLNGWLEARYDFWLARSPLEQAYLGLKTNADKWDDLSEARRLDDVDRVQKELADLRGNFQARAMLLEGSLSYRLYEYRCEQLIKDFAWRHHEYPVSQIDGWQQEIPSFLMNIHQVEKLEDAQAYLARLQGVDVVVDQVIKRMRLGEGAGVLAPKFAYANVLRDCRNLLSGTPFDNQMSGNSPLWGDISAKIDSLDIKASVKHGLRSEAIQLLMTMVRPAFLRLMYVCEDQQTRAATDDGV